MRYASSALVEDRDRDNKAKDAEKGNNKRKENIGAQFLDFFTVDSRVKMAEMKSHTDYISSKCKCFKPLMTHS